jgi:hypothetical protein
MNDEPELIYTLIDLDVWEIKSKKFGKIGFINYNIKLGLWVFLPEKNIFYKPVHLALIVVKLNELNNYYKEVK